MKSECLQVKGGNPLKGEIRAAGAKNATTKLLIASLISDKKSRFYNVPNIGDVEITVDLCREIGAQIEWDKEKKILEIQTPHIHTSYVSQRFSGANRIPILLIGALLGRTQEDIIVPTLGGDLLGKRPLNFHISALKQLGAEIEYRTMKKEGAYFAQAHRGLIGNIISLPYPSVGATENALLAAIRAKGKTIIENAAIEPEIIDIICYLQKMGASISFQKDRTIEIEGKTHFKEVEHHILPDRNEVASYAMAAISTKGSIFIRDAKHEHMLSFLYYLKKVGAGFTIQREGISFFYDQPLKGNVVIETDVHPGFMTDWQQPFGVLLTQCEGISLIHETVYENRFGYTHTLKEMGANISLYSDCIGKKICRYSNLNHQHSAAIQGVTKLQAKNISIPDLRAGFAYVMAALIAEESMLIHQANFLDRGYENIVGKLQTLGADIARAPLKQEQPLEKLLARSAKV